MTINKKPKEKQQNESPCKKSKIYKIVKIMRRNKKLNWGVYVHVQNYENYTKLRNYEKSCAEIGKNDNNKESIPEYCFDIVSVK